MNRQPRLLLILRAGEKSVHRSWLWTLFDLVDIAISTFDDFDYTSDGVARFFHHFRGGKLQGIKNFFESHPDALNRYDYFWLFEDDLTLPLTSVKQIIQSLSQFQFALSAPALNNESIMGYPINMRNSRFLLRGTDFVEQMAPIMSRDFLLEALPAFGDNYSGFGQEWLWQKLLRRRHSFAVIFDSAPVTHTRPYSLGSLKNNKPEGSPDFVTELHEFLRKHEIFNSEPKNLFGVTAYPDCRVLVGDEFVEEGLRGYDDLERLCPQFHASCVTNIKVASRSNVSVNELNLWPDFRSLEIKLAETRGPTEPLGASKKLHGNANLGSAATADLLMQHPLFLARELRTRKCDPPPRILIAILAKQKQDFLPLYLDCIEALDYPKSAIVLYVRTNNNTDATEAIIREWLARVRHLYLTVEFEAEDVDAKVEQFAAHEWNASRFAVLGHIRSVSLQRAEAHDCDFYFVADVDNFVRPCTLRELVALDLPIVAPLLRSIKPGAYYSNYHADVDANGYYRDCDQYQWILNRWIRGIIEVPVVHCTYLIRRNVMSRLNYVDGSDRYEYVIFSDSARQSLIPQYIDNRQVYGYITFGEGHGLHVRDGLQQVRALMAAVGDERLLP